MSKPNLLLFNETGRLRSGWRATIFLFSFAFVSISLGVAVQIVISALSVEPQTGTILFLVVNSFLSLIPALGFGWLYGKLFEGLPFRAIGAAFTKGWLVHWVVGIFIGAITLGLAVLLAFTFGGLRFELDVGKTSDEILASLVLSFVVFGVAAAFEEVLFRGYILQTFSRAGLAWLAILLTSLFFGAVHLGNPNVSVISTIDTVVAGIWFSVAYLKTRDLWLVWGMHLMWNWMQGSFFGIEVSGLTNLSTAPLLREIDSGPVWLTGGSYGIEGSIASTFAIIVSTAAIYLLPIAKRDDEMFALSEPEADR